MIDFRKERMKGYKYYHCLMMMSGDCDPAYPMLNYIADRFEINTEQRYWLAFLYSSSYCGATAYYMFNEFPDYENVDVGRLGRWWDANKQKCLFQTDRLRVKTQNQFVRMFESYRDFCGDSQENKYKSLLRNSPQESYDSVYGSCGDLYYFGRFSLFMLIEAVEELTGLKVEPTGIPWKDALSSRNGLFYAMGRDEWIDKDLTEESEKALNDSLIEIVSSLNKDFPGYKHTPWSVETTACAYKKLFRNKRYMGYYIDRQMVEIQKMQNNVKDGVNWDPLWDFRREYFAPVMLGEISGWSDVRKEMMSYFTRTGNFVPDSEGSVIEHNSCDFPGIDKIYILTK